MGPHWIRAVWMRLGCVSWTQVGHVKLPGKTTNANGNDGKVVFPHFGAATPDPAFALAAA